MPSNPQTRERHMQPLRCLDAVKLGMAATSVDTECASSTLVHTSGPQVLRQGV